MIQVSYKYFCAQMQQVEEPSHFNCRPIYFLLYSMFYLLDK